MSLELEDQYDKVYKYCYFKVKNTQLAEDLTQETFLKYFNQNTYINRGKPLSYLYTIAKNLCFDEYKKQEQIELSDSYISRENIKQVETSFLIKQAINKLDEDLQEIILLRYANDLQTSEIGTITNLSRFAVHRKIKKAIKQLKNILKREDFYE